MSCFKWDFYSCNDNSVTGYKLISLIGALITGMGPAESGILNNSWLPPHNGTLPGVSPVSGAGKVRITPIYLKVAVFFTWNIHSKNGMLNLLLVSVIPIVCIYD